MAEVFLATHRDTPDSIVVLKRILPHLERKKDFVQMFVDEARLTSMFDHRNLVRVLDFGKAEGVHFLVMEFIDGVPLSALIKSANDTALPLSLGCWMVAETCAALQYAHTSSDQAGEPMGIIHRDVSPDNILLSRFGEVKLSDFGIAKASVQNTRTRPGQIKGKFAYMSPEQSLQQEIDHRSDIFSAGLVLYELTTGKRVFDQPNDAEVLHAIATRDFTPVDEVAPNYPAQLAQILTTTLSWDPNARYQSAAALQDALLDFVGDDIPQQADELAERVMSLWIPPFAADANLPVTQGATSGGLPGPALTWADDTAKPHYEHTPVSYGAPLTSSEETEIDSALTTPFGVRAMHDIPEEEDTVIDAAQRGSPGRDDTKPLTALGQGRRASAPARQADVAPARSYTPQQGYRPSASDSSTPSRAYQRSDEIAAEQSASVATPAPSSSIPANADVAHSSFHDDEELTDQEAEDRALGERESLARVPSIQSSHGEDSAAAASVFETQAPQEKGPTLTGPLVPPVLVGGVDMDVQSTPLRQSEPARSRSDETARFVEDLVSSHSEGHPEGSVFMNQDALAGIEGFPWGWVILGVVLGIAAVLLGVNLL